ncbi:TPA: RICIN domain-containing protein [Streptococcus suis]|nr:RICIN domain-containing protein [Streptococcus suis]
MSTRKRKRFILEHKRKIKLAKSLFLAGITAGAVGLQTPGEVYANTDEVSSILTSTVVLDNTNGEEINDATKGSIEISVETDDNSEIEELDGLRTETDTGLENVSTVTAVDKEPENKVNKSIPVTLNNESNDETESTLTSEVIDTGNTQLDEEKLVDTSTELEPENKVNKSIPVTLNNESNDETESTLTSEVIDTGNTQLDEEKLVDTSTELEPEMLTGSIDGLLDSSVEKRNDTNNSSNKVLNSFLGRGLSDISNSTSKNSNRSSDELYSSYSTSSNGASLYSSTNGVTREEAVAWARSRVGQYSYYAGTGNSRFWAGQCVALIRLFAEHKFPHWRHNGNAKDYITNVPLPAGWQRIKNSSTFVPLPGDIALYNPAPVNGGYGHIGIIIEADINTSLSVEQNVDAPYQGGPAKLVRGHYRNFWGVIRPNYATPAPVAPPVNRVDVGKAATESGQSVSDGDYHIVSTVNPNFGIDVQSANPANGTNIQLLENAAVPDQIFTVKHIGNGYYTIVHKATGNSVDATSTALGANVNSYSLHGGHNQQWVLRRRGAIDAFEIINRHSGLVLDIAGGHISSGTNIQLWESNGTGAQAFKFVSVDNEAKRSIADGVYYIVTKANEQLRLTEASAGNDSYSNAQMNAIMGNLNQKFEVKYLGNGYYSLTSTATGRSLDTFSNSSYNAASVVMHNTNGSDAQQWIIFDKGNGYFEILSKKKNMSLDFAGSSSTERNAYLWVRNGSDNQLWKFEVVVTEGWKKDAKGWWYQNDDGSYPKNDWKLVDKKWYYFDNSGYMQVGWQTVGQDTYYFHPDGHMASEQWVYDKAQNIWNYVNKSGRKVKNSWINDYYLKPDGNMATSQWIQSSGIWFYVNQSGKKVRNTWIGDYYLKSDGRMVTSQWIQSSGIWYYVDQSGKKVRNIWVGDYYLKPNGAMATSQWIQSSGIWYYVDQSGKKVKNSWIGDYYLKSDGRMVTSQWVQTAGVWYFVDKLGKKVRATWIDGYYLQSDGTMARDTWIDGIYVDHSGKKRP